MPWIIYYLVTRILFIPFLKAVNKVYNWAFCTIVDDVLFSNKILIHAQKLCKNVSSSHSLRVPMAINPIYFKSLLIYEPSEMRIWPIYGLSPLFLPKIFTQTTWGYEEPLSSIVGNYANRDPYFVMNILSGRSGHDHIVSTHMEPHPKPILIPDHPSFF